MVTPAAENLPAKIRHLLEKFGKLREAPSIAETSEGIVATATFETAYAARNAAQTLHGVDKSVRCSTGP